MKLVEKKYALPFVAVTALFALWGVANDITNPMVAAFQTLMELPARKASLIQFAFYGGYATMAVPAALFIRRYSYKKGILPRQAEWEAYVSQFQGCDPKAPSSAKWQMMERIF